MSEETKLETYQIEAKVEGVWKERHGVCIGEAYMNLEENREITRAELGIEMDKKIWINPIEKIQESAMIYLKKGKVYKFNMVKGATGFKFSSWESGGDTKVVDSTPSKATSLKETKTFLKILEAPTSLELQDKVNSLVLAEDVSAAPITRVNDSFCAFVWYVDDVRNHKK